MTEARFAVNVDVEGTDDVQRAEDAIQKLGQQVLSDTKELRAMQSALRNLKGSTNVAEGTIQSLKDKIALHKIVIAESQAKYIDLGGAFKGVSKGAQDAGASVASAADKQAAAAETAANALKNAADQARAASKARADSALVAAEAERNLKVNTLAAGDQILKSAKMADSAKINLDALGKQISVDTAKFNELSAALRSLGKRTGANAGTFDKLSGKIAAQNKNLQFAKAKFIDAGGSVEKLTKQIRGTGEAAEPLRERLARLSEAGGLLPGPLGAATSQMGALRTLMSGGMLAATVALTAVVVALSAALAAGVTALLLYGAKLAAATRDQLLLNEALIASNKAFKGSAETAASLDARVSSVASNTALAKDGVQKYADQLYKANFRGEALTNTLQMMSDVAAAGGDVQAQKFLKATRAAAALGNSITAVAEKYDKKFGAIAAKRTQDFGVQIQKLKENLQRVFGGLKIDGFLRELHVVTDLFQENSAVSDALSSTFKMLFQPLVDGATGALPSVRALIQELVIKGLEIQIIWLKVRNALRDAIKGTFLERLLTTNNLLSAMKGIAIGLTVIVGGGLLLAFGAVTALLAPFAALIGGIGIAITNAGNIVAWFGQQWHKLTEIFGKINWSEVGKNVVMGIVSGITGQWGKAVETVTGLAKSVLGAFNSEAEIKSPSRKMQRSGVYLVQGSIGGMKAQEPALRAQVKRTANIAMGTGVQASARSAPRLQAPAVAAPKAPRAQLLAGFSLKDALPAPLRAAEVPQQKAGPRIQINNNSSSQTTVNRGSAPDLGKKPPASPAIEAAPSPARASSGVGSSRPIQVSIGDIEIKVMASGDRDPADVANDLRNQVKEIIVDALQDALGSVGVA